MIEKTFIAFEIAKLKRQLKMQGKSYDFSRVPLNEFGNPDLAATPTVISVDGIFHQSQGYVTITSTADSRILKKQTPMMLGLWTEMSVLKMGDKVTVSGIVYKLVEVINLSNMNFAADVSLEEVK